MSETAKVYERVCAKCPAAKVEGLVAPTPKDNCWTMPDVIANWRDDASFPDSIAEAIITSHWLTLLPPRYNLHKCRDGKYWIAYFGDGAYDFVCEHESDTPFLALAAYLEESNP